MNPAPGSVLAVMAHPDDAELWAGGTLALHAAHDAVRDAEARAGAEILGASLRLLEPAPRMPSSRTAQRGSRSGPQCRGPHPRCGRRAARSLPRLAASTHVWTDCR